MSDQPVRFTPLGNLDKDSEYKLVGKGNYIDALDIIKQDDGGQVSGTIQPTKRNKHAFSLGSVQAQNKKYRVTVSGDATKSHALKFLSTKRDYRITTGTGANGEVEFNGTISSLQSAFFASNLPGAFQVTVSGNTMEFELVAYNYYQWYSESVGDDDVEVVCIQEAIPTDLAGPLKDIGSYDLLGDLFIFSTTQDNEPEKTTLTVGGVGLGGPLTLVFFNQPHNLTQGQWIRIANSNAPWLNGLFLVNEIVSAVDINIVTDTAWGASHLPFVVGQEKIFIHPVGIGEIGVAQKNNSTESWDYTRLLRSVELNFVSKWKVDCDAEKNIRRTSIYFDDDYNPYRKFYYNGEYITDGALLSTNSDALYQYDNIGELIFGHSTKPNIQIDLIGQNPSGGVLEAGNIRYFVVFKDVFENESLPTDLSNIVIVYEDSQDGIAIGNDAGEVTSKSNNLRITGVNNNIFTEFALGYYRLVEGVASAILLDFSSVSGSEINVTHTGLEPEITFDAGLLASNKNDDYLFAKNIRILDQRTVRSNLRKRDYTDLAEWFPTFKHRICVHRINETRPFPDQEAGEYKDPLNGFYRLGYMYNETYRVSGRVHLKDGSITEWFWIDDIRVDPFLNNQANPDDDRRDQTGADISTSFDLTVNVGTDSYSHKAVLVPYIDLFGADLSVLVGGTSLQEIATHIEFGRAEVIPEVIACGVAVSSVKIRLAKDNPSSSGSGSVDLSIADVNRGFPMGGRFGAVAAGSGNTHPEVFIGTGVRTSDVDGLTETYHEYPWGQGGAYCAMAASTSNQIPPNYTTENFVISGNSTVDENFDNYVPEIEYPQGQGVNFYNTEFVVSFQTQGSYATVPVNDSAFSSERRILSIYSPDILMGYSVGNSVSIIDFGEMLLDTTQFFTRGWRHSNTASSTVILPSIATRYHSENLLNTYNQYNIDNAQFIEEGGRKNLFGFTGFRKAYDAYRFKSKGGSLEPEKAGWTNLWNQKEGPVVYVENGGNGITQQGKNTDHGVRYVQLFTKKQDKYGSIESTSYYTTGAKFQIGGSSISGVVGQGTFNVFGGDTFTQSSNLKTRIQNIGANPAGTDPETWGNSMVADFGIGFGGAVIVYTQNRVNAQMRFDTDEQFINLKDTLNIGVWAWDWQQIDRDTYSSVYTPINTGLSQASGNFIGSRYTNDYPTRMHWSERKIYGEIMDQFTIFLPLNIKDLDLKFGQIDHHEDIGGELFTLQPRKYQLQYFNTRGTLQGSNEGVEVLIGDGSVLSRDGQTLSSYGTQHKWSVVKGSSPGGKDVIYWFNQENGLFMRFGADGTIVLSERHGMRSFSANNTRWTENQHTPALNYGIRSVWDDRFKEAIWTFIGLRDSKGEWGTLPSNQLYAEGDTVTNNTFINYPFDGVPDVYVSLSIHAPIPQSEPGVGNDWETYWRRVDKDDPEYYSVFTIAFNELSNGFSTFYSHLPKTYLKWKNKFLSSHPTERSEMYEHRLGYDKWYEYEGVWKESEPYLEGVVNPFPDQSKKFVAIQALTDNVPDRIELKTKDHESFLVATDFDAEDDAWRTPIKNDILTSQTGDPNDDTESLVGAYMRIKFKFFNGAYNKLNNLVVKVRQRLRRT
jgi:hypothetical protein